MQLSLTLRLLTLHGPHDLLGLPQYTMFGVAQTHTVSHESATTGKTGKRSSDIILHVARVNSRVVVRTLMPKVVFSGEARSWPQRGSVVLLAYGTTTLFESSQVS